MATLIIESAIALVIAYSLGSVSWAYVVGRLARGVDMTEVGDGRIGAAFAMRKVGLAWGILVGLMDFLKGVVAVGLPLALGLPVIVTLLAGLAAVAGHNWSIFLNFKGGRGTATSLGILVTLALWPLLIGAAIVAVALYLSRGALFVWVVRRTTLLFAALMAIISLLLWADMRMALLPVISWAPEVSPLLASYPPCLWALNATKGAEVA